VLTGHHEAQLAAFVAERSPWKLAGGRLQLRDAAASPPP
jgi:hypothetical protein